MIRFVLALIAVFFLIQPASAQTLEYTQFYKKLREYNESKPLQNPKYERLDEIQKRRILDSTNKTLGEVHHIVIDEKGSIQSIATAFDRLRLTNEVFLDYNDLGIQAFSNSYILGFEDNELEEIYPSLLANIETAAGDNGYFTADSLMNQKVKSQDGRIVGTVTDVLFDDNGSNVDALYVSVEFGTIRGRGVAVPFDDVKYVPSSYKTSVNITKSQADAILEIAKRR